MSVPSLFDICQEHFIYHHSSDDDWWFCMNRRRKEYMKIDPCIHLQEYKNELYLISIGQQKELSWKFLTNSQRNVILLPEVILRKEEERKFREKLKRWNKEREEKKKKFEEDCEKLKYTLFPTKQKKFVDKFYN